MQARRCPIDRQVASQSTGARAVCTRVGELSFCAFLAIVLFVLVGQVARALTFVVQGGQAEAGDTPDVCIVLPDNDGTVAGFQMDLVWDSSCLSVDQASAGEGACYGNPEARRAMFRTALRGANGLRVLALNLTDTSPIPAAVRDLFCCQFRVAPAAGGRTCSISVSEVIASDPKGNRLPNVRGVPGAIIVRAVADQRGVGAPGAGPGAAVLPPVLEGGTAPEPFSRGSAPPPAGSSSGGGAGREASGPAVPAPPRQAPQGVEPGLVGPAPGEPPVAAEVPPTLGGEGGGTQGAGEAGDEEPTVPGSGTPGRTPSPKATPVTEQDLRAHPTDATPAGSPKARREDGPEGTPTPVRAGTPTKQSTSRDRPTVGAGVTGPADGEGRDE